MTESKTKALPKVGDVVLYTDPDGNEVPALVHSHAGGERDLNLFVADGKVDPLRFDVPEQTSKDQLKVWRTR